MVLLHGNLYVHVSSGSNIPGEKLGGLGKGCIGKKLESLAGKVNRSEAYLVMSLDESKSRLRTSVVNSHNPVWDEEFDVQVADDVQELLFVLKDDDAVGSDMIGCFKIPVENFFDGQLYEGEFEILDDHGRPIEGNKDGPATVKLSVKYMSVDKEYADHNHGFGKEGVITPAYFPLRKGNRVLLFNDAVSDKPGEDPQIPLANGMLFQHRSAWDAVYNDLMLAEQFIYIAGWSVADNIHLVRTKDTDFLSEPTLGDILKQKADKQGVKVLMLVWDDQTSTMFTAGVMGTKDEETKKFFKSSDVECQLVARVTQEDSMVRKVAMTTTFTHHQKIIICDAPPLDGARTAHRRVVAYIGGLDLTLGRYDSPDHPLFSTLDTLHKDDYYQGCITGADVSKGGPRQPWHDIHSRIEGPAAWDVVENFEQRWMQQASRLKRSKLLDFRKTKEIYLPNNTNNEYGDPAIQVIPPEDTEAWNVQLLRSIDSGAAAGLPEDNKEAIKMGLRTGKGSIVEASIHTAYVTAIRRAQQFIFIENQYFLGSSQLWKVGGKPGVAAWILIPGEIALKICSKIRAGERFVAYIVIPLYPEGIPESGSVQEILYWQAQTMRMMYGMISETLKSMGSSDSVTDYLQFYFVGKREPPVDGETPAPTADPKSQQGRYQASRRFMIYVHSKMLIVDDEYIIVGSANINMRSMSGARDTEICIGAYQPAHTLEAAGGQLPAGQVHGFRMALWDEHTGTVDPVYNNPASLECARKIRSMGQANWDTFVDDGEIRSLPHGHLCCYPVKIGEDGSVSNLDGVVNFPDTKATILGADQALPDFLTT